MSLSVRENGLHVIYTEAFYKSEESDSIFEELYKLNFKKLQLKIAGKSYTPLRKVCAFADSGMSYKFSGTSIEGEEWTPLILKLKKDVETKVGTHFNYVLVNLYENGHAKIGAHKDDERELDPDAPIASLSFGAERNFIFQREGFRSATLTLQHGSLCVMLPPTNKMWKHCIPEQPDVKEPRINLTFRKLSENSAKKRKLQTTEEDIPENDWMTHYVQQEKISSISPTYFELSYSARLTVKEFNGNLRVDIRRFKHEKQVIIPTKEGIVLSPETWYHFCKKIYEFNFVYKDASFVANNCLLALNLEEGLHLQHMDCLPNDSPRLKDTFIKLSYCELNRMLEYEADITKCISERLWTDMLPRKFSLLCQPFSPPSSNSDEMFKAFINCLETIMAHAIRKVFHCNGCIVDSNSQLNHDCLYTPIDEKLRSLGDRVWLLLDIDETVKDLREIQSLSENVMKGLTMEDYKRLLFVQDTCSM